MTQFLHSRFCEEILNIFQLHFAESSKQSISLGLAVGFKAEESKGLELNFKPLKGSRLDFIVTPTSQDILMIYQSFLNRDSLRLSCIKSFLQ